MGFQHAWGCRFDGFWAKLFTDTDVRCITNDCVFHVHKLKRAREVGKSLKRTKKVSLYRDSGEIQVASYCSYFVVI